MKEDGGRPQKRQGPRLEAVDNCVAGWGGDPAVEAGGCPHLLVEDEGGDALVVGVGGGGGGGVGGGGVFGLHVFFFLEGVGEEDLERKGNIRMKLVEKFTSIPVF